MGKTNHKPEASDNFSVMHFLGSAARVLHDGFQAILPDTEKLMGTGRKSLKKPIEAKATPAKARKKGTTPIETAEPESRLAPEDVSLHKPEEPSFKVDEEAADDKNETGAVTKSKKKEPAGKTKKEAKSKAKAAKAPKKTMPSAEEPETRLAAEDASLPKPEEPAFKGENITSTSEEPVATHSHAPSSETKEGEKKVTKKPRRLDNPLFDLTS